MKVDFDKYELQELLSYIKQLKNCLHEAPIDFLGTGSNGEAADKEELEWRDKWQQAYINAEAMIDVKLKRIT